MGFGTIIGQIIFFMVLIVVIANIFIYSIENTKSYSEAKKYQNLILYEKDNSKISIKNITINYGSINNISVVVENQGSINLDPDLFSFYLDNVLITANLTKTIFPDNINPGIVDPGEFVNITYYNISSGDHYISIINEFSYKTSRVVKVS